MGELIVLSDYRAQKAVAKRGAGASELFLSASFIAAAAWLEALDEAVKLCCTLPGGTHDER